MAYFGESGSRCVICVEEASLETDLFADDDCFVEVKYGGSRMSERQRHVADLLEEAGHEVYVLRGTPESYVFERHDD